MNIKMVDLNWLTCKYLNNSGIFNISQKKYLIREKYYNYWKRLRFYLVSLFFCEKRIEKSYKVFFFQFPKIILIYNVLTDLQKNLDI